LALHHRELQRSRLEGVFSSRHNKTANELEEASNSAVKALIPVALRNCNEPFLSIWRERRDSKYTSEKCNFSFQAFM